MYIYDQQDWPHFQWDQQAISKKLATIRHHQGRLMGAMESIGFGIADEVVLNSLTLDVVKSIEIEGELLDAELVRSSVANRLGLEAGGLEKRDRHIDGVVEMVLDATQHFDHPVTEERLFGWHAALFPTGWSGLSRIEVGTWRKSPVQVVSGHYGKEEVHFEGVPQERVKGETDQLIEWINQEHELDLVLKSAIAHLWFVTVHPFEDGNARISRALADLLLARSEQSHKRFYSLSSQIQRERKTYYSILESTQKGNMEVTPWLEWYLDCFGRAIDQAQSELNVVLRKSRFWERLPDHEYSERQRKILNRLLDGIEGKLTSSKWAKMAKCSQDSGYRDIMDLVRKGILTKDPGGGRSTSYSLVIPEELKHLWDESTTE